MKKNLRTIIFSLFFLFIGFVFGIFIPHFRGRCDITDYKYINLDLICEEKKAVRKGDYTSLRNKLVNFIEENKTEKVVTNVSIYFRDLQNGPTMGIEEHALFSPASLLKLPLFLTYQNLENVQNLGLSDVKIVAQNAENIPDQSILPLKSIQYGQSYSIKDLLTYMIKYSDNKAYYVLLDYLHQISPERDLLKDTFVDLGIIDPKDLLDNTISVKSYGSIFTQLYNSSYFSEKKVSDQVLSILTDIDWKNGINAGLPSDIKVAHKFGERFGVDGALKQLHDCGIVYYPNNPYLLCIMTRGFDLDQLAKVIGEISKMVYEEFDSRKL